MPADRPWPWSRLDPVNVAALIAPCLPDGRRVPLTFLGEGDFCLAFRYGGKIVRVARHQRAADALRQEACFLSSAAMWLPLPVPQPVMSEDDRCPPYSIHDEIVGEVLTRGRWDALPSVARKRAVADLADFLRKLHAIPRAIAHASRVETLDAGEFAADLLPLASAAIFQLLKGDTCRRLDQILGRWAEEPFTPPQPECPLHCDISPGHLFFDPATGELTGVIDFGDLALGDPARDFVHIAEDFGATILDEVLVEYAGDEAASLKPRIRQWSLLELVSWCVDLRAGDRDDELAEAVAGIERKLAEWRG